MCCVFFAQIPYTPDFTAAVSAETASKSIQLALEVSETMVQSMTLPSPSLLQMPSKGSALVADDAPLILSLMRKQLADLGFAEVQTCTNGKEALELLKQKEYDIVFFDSFMPLMTGPEATRRFRDWESTSGRTKKQLMVAMSANSEQEDIRESESIGFHPKA